MSTKRSNVRAKKARAADDRRSFIAVGLGRAPMAETQRIELELQTLQGFRTIVGSARSHDTEVRRIAQIPGSQLWALSEIAKSQGMRVNELSDRMALHQTTTSNLVNALVERKLIRRVRDRDDQRIVRLHLLAEGKRLLIAAPGPYAGLLVDALRRMDDIELEKLRMSLEVLVQIIRNPAASAAGEPLMGA